MKKFSILACLLALSCSTAFAQLSYGFKTGLNFSTFDGPLEVDANGVSEEFVNNTGFHLAAVVGYKFNNFVGVKGELQYSQKGVRQRYQGTGYQILDLDNGNTTRVTGDRTFTLGVDNSYFDMPLMVYAKPFKWLEVSAGANFGVLIGATGIGESRFTNVRSPLGNNVDDFSFDLSHNYGKDAFDDELASTEFIIIDGARADLPSTTGAYFDYNEDFGNYFNRFDMGLVAGLSVFISKSLYVGGRINFGLSDVTNNDYDRSIVSLNQDGSFIDRADVDKNRVIQVSVGFSF